MHIPDNYLSPQTDAVMAVAMVPVWVHCIKKVRATLDREHMAFLGICAAFSFLLMMFNVPLPGGTTGHAVGGALIALLLGPEAAAIAVSVALALQALLFGDGGVLSFGANCFNMAFALTYRSDDHTLTSEEVEKAHQKIVTKVCKGVNGEVRS